MTLPSVPSIHQLVRFQYGDQYQSELPAITEMREQYGLTVAVDTDAGVVTFMPGHHPYTLDDGYVIYYPIS